MSFNTGQLVIGEPLSGSDQTQRIWDSGQFTFSATRGERGQKSISLCITPGQSYEPEIGWGVWAYDPPIGQAGSQCIFVGTVEDREVGYIGDDNLRIWELSVISLEQMFDTQPCPDASFDEMDAGDIVAALFALVVQTIPVTVGTIEAGVFIHNRTFDSKTNIWSAIKQLAVDSNLITYIDPRDQKFYFISSGSRTTPFSLTSSMLLQNGSSPMLKYKQSRSDFRNQQIAQAPPAVMPLTVESFVCDGATDTFTLSTPAQQIVGASLTTSALATATGSFSGGVPSDGDTITVGSTQYTMRTAITNSVQYEVLIGATASACAVNLAAAINAASTGQGTLYSSPTARNISASAGTPSGGDVPLTALLGGNLGNSISLTESCANFTWSAGTMTGGVDGITINLSVGVQGTGIFGLFYQPGSQDVTVSPMPGSGQSLMVVFSGPSSNLLPVANDAAAGFGIGTQYAVASPRNVMQQEDIAQQSNAILTGFSTLPGEFTFETYTAGFFVGDRLPVALTVPTDAAARLNSTTRWLIQDVHASWTEGFENLPDDNPNRHFRYSVHCIDTVQFNNYQETLQRLVDVGPDLNGQIDPQDPITGGTDAIHNNYSIGLELVDVTVADDIAPHVVVSTPLYSLSPLNYLVGQAQRLMGVLKKTIAADTTVRINKLTNGSPVSTTSWTITFPSGTPVDEVVTVEIYGEIFDGDIFSADVLASDGQATDANGILSVLVQWI